MARRQSPMTLPQSLETADQGLVAAIGRLEYLDPEYLDEFSELVDARRQIDSTLRLVSRVAVRLSELAPETEEAVDGDS
jgi:hypothetical protein